MFCRRRLRCSSYPRRITVIDQNAGKHLGVEFDMPGAPGGGANDDVRHERLDRAASERPAGLWIELPDLGQHVGDILLIDIADLPQGGNIPFCEEGEIGDERFHRRIEAVAFAQLDGETFGEIARADARWVEGLNKRQKAIEAFDRNLQTGRSLVERTDVIACVINGIDQHLANQAIDWISRGEGQLLFKVILEAELRRRICLEIRASPSPVPPPDEPDQEVADSPAPSWRSEYSSGVAALSSSKALDSSVPRLSSRELRSVAKDFRSPVRLRRLVEVLPYRRVRDVGHRLGVRRVNSIRRLVGTLQQRVALELFLNEGGQLHVGELQKLDRLQKLWRHNQGLSLAHHELSTKRHVYVDLEEMPEVKRPTSCL